MQLRLAVRPNHHLHIIAVQHSAGVRRSVAHEEDLVSPEDPCDQEGRAHVRGCVGMEPSARKARRPVFVGLGGGFGRRSPDPVDRRHELAPIVARNTDHAAVRVVPEVPGDREQALARARVLKSNVHVGAPTSERGPMGGLVRTRRSQPVESGHAVPERREATQGWEQFWKVNAA